VPSQGLREKEIIDLHAFYYLYRRLLLIASPTRVISLATQKVQLTTLATSLSLHTPTDLLFYSLLYLKYYFSFLFYYIFLSTLNQR
jgi:hypothetical protein